MTQGQPSQNARSGRSGLFDGLLWRVLIAFALATPANAAPPPEDEFIPELPKLWLNEVEVRAWAGYKDNLTLNRAATEQSLLIGSGVDVTIARLPLDGKQFNFLLSFDDTRYPQGRDVTHEDFLFALAQFKADVSAQARLGLDARYVFQDQVVDTSVTETNLAATAVLGHGFALVPNARWNLAGATWLELSGTAQRQYYEEPLDDYWEGGPKLMLGHDYGHRSSITLAGAWMVRGYDTREQVSLSGTNIPGTSLDFSQYQAELAWRHHWDARRRWRTATRLEFQVNQDNGPGFYDYRRYGASQQIHYVASTWEIRAQARVSYYDFEFQEVSLTNPELRKKAIVGASLRAEKKLGKHWSLFAEYEYEQSLSNRDLDEYRSNRVASGVGLRF